MIRLYSYWRSTAAYRVRIALHLKGLDYEYTSVNLLDGERTAYRAKNPQGLVPALEFDGQIITQSLAILEFLEEQHSEPALLPTDPLARAMVRSQCNIVCADTHPLNNLRVLNYLRGQQMDEAQVNGWYQHWIAEGLAPLERAVARTRGRYCVGNAVSMADVCLVPQLYNARRFECDLTPYKHLVEIATDLETQPAFIAALPDRQPDAPQS